MVNAAKSEGERPVTVFLDEPCRMVHTGSGIGGRNTPIGAGEEHIVTGTGVSGNCDVPTDAVGLIGNATAINATTNTNLRFYPADATGFPQVSNLNPRPGAPPTPNAVTVGLSSSDQFKIRNAFGTVDVIFDVTAYLVDHRHAEYDNIESNIDETDRAVLGTSVGTNTVVEDVVIDADAAGDIHGSATATFFAFGVDARVECSLTTGTTVESANRHMVDISANKMQTMTVTRGFELTGPLFLFGATDTVRLVCSTTVGTATVFDSSIQASLIPDTTEPGLVIIFP